MSTPKTLREAIQRELCIGPLSTTEERLFQAIKDFLAQRFGVAVLKNHESEHALLELFRLITAEAQKDEELKNVG